MHILTNSKYVGKIYEYIPGSELHFSHEKQFRISLSLSLSFTMFMQSEA